MTTTDTIRDLYTALVGVKGAAAYVETISKVDTARAAGRITPVAAIAARLASGRAPRSLGADRICQACADLRRRRGAAEGDARSGDDGPRAPRGSRIAEHDLHEMEFRVRDSIAKNHEMGKIIKEVKESVEGQEVLNRTWDKCRQEWSSL